jgi:hypothetical protein
MRLASNGAVIPIDRVLIVMPAVLADACSRCQHYGDLTRVTFCLDLSDTALDQVVNLIL